MERSCETSRSALSTCSPKKAAGKVARRSGKTCVKDGLSAASVPGRGRGRDPSDGHVRTAHAGHPSSLRRNGRLRGGARASARRRKAEGSSILCAKRNGRQRDTSSRQPKQTRPPG